MCDGGQTGVQQVQFGDFVENTAAEALPQALALLPPVTEWGIPYSWSFLA